MAEIKTQEQFDKLRDQLKAGRFSDDPDLELELAQAAEAWKSAQVTQEPEPEKGFLESFAEQHPFARGNIAMLETLGSVASGIPAGIAGGLAGGVVAPLAGNDAGVRTVQATQEALTFQPRTPMGQLAVEKLGNAFQTLQTGIQDAITTPAPFGLGIKSPGLATAVQTGIEGASMLVGARRGRIPTSKMNTSQKVANLASEKGIIITPGEQGARSASLLEGAVGRARTRQLAANKNIQAYNRLANQTLGRADDAPISMKDLANYRRERSAAYQVIDDFGDMSIDTQFRKQVRQSASDIRTAARDIPSLADPDVARLLDVIDDLTAPNRVGRPVNSQSLRGALARLRAKTDEAFKAGNNDIALAYKDLAKNLEDVVDRNLQRSGNLQALEEFRQARQDIAKSYSVQEALAGDDIINPASLASQRKRGVPLTDELELIARAHEQFPQSTAVTPVTRGNPIPVSGVDALTVAGGLATGNVPLALAPVGAAGVRSFLSSPTGAGLAAPIRTSVPGLLVGGELAKSPEQR